MRASPTLSNGALAVAPVIAASLLGAWATYPNLVWYDGLAKPSFNPPNWIFGPVWTTLYLLMAIAAFRILQRPTSTPGRGAALRLYWVQIALNIAWSWMFFAAQSPLLGFWNIVLQLFAVLATFAAFRRIDRIAALCLMPLAGWVAFASLINLVIWQLNP
jgi:benzodiazapine receptor